MPNIALITENLRDVVFADTQVLNVFEVSDFSADLSNSIESKIDRC